MKKRIKFLLSSNPVLKITLISIRWVVVCEAGVGGEHILHMLNIYTAYILEFHFAI